MLKIYHYDEESFHIIFRIYEKEGIKIISQILSNIDDSIYLDWQYILEEINEKDSIINKKIEVKLHKLSQSKRVIVVSPIHPKMEILAIAAV